MDVWYTTGRINATDPIVDVCRFLDSLTIPWKLQKHPTVYTVDQALGYWEAIPGGHAKKPFLRDKKGRRHVLAVPENDTAFHIRAFGGRHGAGNLSFASPERLRRWPGVEPGSITPFGLINDAENHVEAFVEERLLQLRSVNSARTPVRQRSSLLPSFSNASRRRAETRLR